MSGLVQIYDAPPVLVFFLQSLALPAVAPHTVTAAFKVPTPDSRLMVSIALTAAQLGDAGTPAQSNPFDMNRGGDLAWSLWLATRDQDTGGSGLWVPTGNLVGTKAAPLAIPADVNIDGYSDDFTGGQDDIYGELTCVQQGGGGLRGMQVRLYVRYQPSTCEICDDEWLEIIEQCAPSLVSQAGSFA